MTRTTDLTASDGVTVMATGYQRDGSVNVHTLAEGVDESTIVLALPTGEYIRVFLDHWGRYRVWLGNLEVLNNGALVARGDIREDAAERLMALKRMRQTFDSMVGRDALQEASDWLSSVKGNLGIKPDHLDYDDLLDWGDTGGGRASLPQRFRNLWRRLMGE